MRAIFLAIMAAFLASGHARAQSFDCATIKTVAARLICGDVELSKADVEMAKAFKAALGRLPGSDKDAFLKDQTNWKRSRNTRCGLDRFQKEPLSELLPAKSCMLQAMAQRTAEFAASAKAASAEPKADAETKAIAETKEAVAPPTHEAAIATTRSASQPETVQPAAKSQTFCRYKWFDGAEAKLTVLVDIGGIDGKVFNDEDSLRAFAKSIGATAHAYCLDQQKAGRVNDTTMTGDGKPREAVAADNAIPDRVEVYIGDPGALPRIRKAFAVSSDGGSFWTIIEPEKLVAR
jgi:uncharacterized protein YecT (DUF1311 family)